MKQNRHTVYQFNTERLKLVVLIILVGVTIVHPAMAADPWESANTTFFRLDGWIAWCSAGTDSLYSRYRYCNSAKESECSRLGYCYGICDRWSWWYSKLFLRSGTNSFRNESIRSSSIGGGGDSPLFLLCSMN